MSFALAHQSKKTKAADNNTPVFAKPFSSQHPNNNLALDSHDSIIIHLQRMIGNQAVQVRSYTGFNFAKIEVQSKLKVTKPADVYEQEADRVAEQVMAPIFVNSKDIVSVDTIDEEKINRKCQSCQDKEEKNFLRKTSSDEKSHLEVSEDLPQDIDC
jgi:hypothetical protein